MVTATTFLSGIWVLQGRNGCGRGQAGFLPWRREWGCWGESCSQTSCRGLRSKAGRAPRSRASILLPRLGSRTAGAPAFLPACLLPLVVPKAAVRLTQQGWGFRARMAGGFGLVDRCGGVRWGKGTKAEKQATKPSTWAAVPAKTAHLMQRSQDTS